MAICTCTICKKGFKAKTGRSHQCGSCRVSKRRWKNKLAIVEYKGGQCERCGYDKHPAALQFHHRDPTTKDYQLNGNKLLKGVETLKIEADKCDLLCANCHSIEHSMYERFSPHV